ncbi:MAG: hypothetical protein Tsb009_26180 [Planctomycetaceae bacterium]
MAFTGCGGKKDSSTDGTSGPSKKNSSWKKSASKKSATEKTAVKTETPQPVPRKSERPRKTKSNPTLPKKSKPVPQTVYRESDLRPKHDAARLAKIGIRKYTSRRLILYTDIDPKVAATLPPLIDHAFDAWVKYFGKLPPTREGDPFQLTGYIMADPARFREAALIPGDLRPFKAGRHRGYEFWMYDQKWPYYRRHLMVHEATHCFMYAVRDVRFPVWYMEGMAELFGTHHFDEKGVPHFGVMPNRDADFPGFGRIEYIQEDVRRGIGKNLNGVLALRADDFGNNHAYGWSWGICKFLDAHPRYQKKFRALGQILTSSQFIAQFRRDFLDDEKDLPFEWQVFTQELTYGFDVERFAMLHKPGNPLPKNASGVTVTLATNRGWQSVGIRLEKGQTYEISATGRFSLAQKPKPWISEPQGVSIFYAGGRPLGMVLGLIRPDRDAVNDGGNRGVGSPLKVIPIGRRTRIRAAMSGTLYVRINDFWSDFANNMGEVTIRVQTAKP